ARWRACWRGGRWLRRHKDDNANGGFLAAVGAARNDMAQRDHTMNIHLTLNGQPAELNAGPGESLMTALRRSGCWSVKHGCETGECGACSVLLDGALVPTCVLLAGQAEGRSVTPVE